MDLLHVVITDGTEGRTTQVFLRPELVLTELAALHRMLPHRFGMYVHAYGRDGWDVVIHRSRSGAKGRRVRDLRIEFKVENSKPSPHA